MKAINDYAARVRRYMYAQNPRSCGQRERGLRAVVSGNNVSIRAQEDSPGLSFIELNQAMHDVDILARGYDENNVVRFLEDAILPDPYDKTTFIYVTGLTSDSNTLMAPYLVPTDPTSPFQVSQPKPGKLYGYSGREAFTES